SEPRRGVDGSAPTRYSVARIAAMPPDCKTQSGAVAHLAGALGGGAGRAAEHAAALLHAVPEDAHVAVGAARRQLLDGAFEAVEHVDRAGHLDLERLIVLVAAGLATSAHGRPSVTFSMGASRECRLRT